LSWNNSAAKYYEDNSGTDATYNLSVTLGSSGAVYYLASTAVYVMGVSCDNSGSGGIRYFTITVQEA
jgi:hypothetical protein